MPSAVIELAPALAETLLICALGYISARLNLLPKQTTGCLSWFASYIALPAMIFQGMATIKIGAGESKYPLPSFTTQAQSRTQAHMPACATYAP